MMLDNNSNGNTYYSRDVWKEQGVYATSPIETPIGGLPSQTRQFEK